MSEQIKEYRQWAMPMANNDYIADQLNFVLEKYNNLIDDLVETKQRLSLVDESIESCQ